ncbi:transposase family protein [Nakamurella antarctica]|uniref:Transposase family protein n=1 Tax=Nakamurella antarctica TaxID=1902245 RepID=A0A3G8ZJ73_9ACTN|nr:transposase family protein [Nakamurella antarctica]
MLFGVLGLIGDRGACDWLFSHDQIERPRAIGQSGSLLLGIDGFLVERVVHDDSGRRVVRCRTELVLEGWCPSCRQQSRSPRGCVTTRPRDLPFGSDSPLLLWRKQKWHCRVAKCVRKVFTENLHGQVPARARITTRELPSAG